MIPWISLSCKSLEIALMSVWLSEDTLSLGNSKVAALMRANLTVSASATRGELTKGWVVEPVIVDGRSVPEKVHASPACFDCLFQAASVVQEIIGDAIVELEGRFAFGFLICKFLGLFSVGV